MSLFSGFGNHSHSHGPGEDSHGHSHGGHGYQQLPSGGEGDGAPRLDRVGTPIVHPATPQPEDGSTGPMQNRAAPAHGAEPEVDIVSV